jgi:hypothetical protein
MVEHPATLCGAVGGSETRCPYQRKGDHLSMGLLRSTIQILSVRKKKESQIKRWVEDFKLTG